MELKSVTEEDAKFLHELLEQREGRINISHKSTPSWDEHLEFVKNHDYLSWDIIFNLVALLLIDSNDSDSILKFNSE